MFDEREVDGESARVLDTLVGRRIARVTYFEIDYEAATPMWTRESGSFDSLDFGLTLHDAAGRRVSFGWSTMPGEYNLAVSDVAIDAAGMRAWDATGRWRIAGELEVVEVHSYWEPWPARGSGPELLDAVRLVLRSGRSITVVAVELRDGTPVAADHVTVFFDPRDLERHRVGPFSRTARVRAHPDTGR